MKFIMGLIKDRGRGFYLSPGLFIGLLVWMGCIYRSQGNGRYGYFSQANNSQVLLPGTVWDVISNNKQTEFSFRTCSDGELLYQSGTGGDFLKLYLVNGTLEFQWKVHNQSDYEQVDGSFNKNEWFNVNIHRLLGTLYLNVSRGGRVFYSEIISNSTFRTYISNLDLTGSSGVYVGRDFTGCFMEGVNVIFTNSAGLQGQNVIWSNQSCTQSDNTCANIANGDINECYSQPCVRGECIDGPNNYTCKCPHLYNGTQCEVDLSVYGCAVQPCLNGGTCIGNENPDSKPNYRCDCVNGFVGINCESDIDECLSQPCQHGTQCTDQVGGYVCNCTGSGFNGTNCDSDIDECVDPTVCGDKGQCFNNQGSYTCQCSDGYFGPACQDVDECISNPCQNNATCQNEVNTFSCTCVAGFTGDQCETDINECEGITCPGSNSECDNQINSYECVCSPGFSGTPGSCTDINECLSSPCRNGASCTNLANDYSCACLPGYTDKNCLTNINECAGNPCLNDATCLDGVNTYTCSCMDGFQGANCETNIDECGFYQDPCFNGGTCNDLINDFNCTCANGFMGDRCTVNINECESNPCGINAIQCNEGAGTFECVCKPGFTGPTCHTNIDECSSQPCQNSGTCVDRENGYTCECTADWMGTHCELVYNACDQQFENCLNGANCSTTQPSHNFSCMCVAGYTGDRCETNIDDCGQSDCILPKVCHDELNGYSCKCPTGYEGADCQTDIDECSSNPCQNGATCTQGLGFYTCQCVSKVAYVPETNSNRSFTMGYEGVNCEMDINECDIVPSICLNRGICQNEVGGFQCLCGRDTDGTYFTGSHCNILTSYCFIAEEVKAKPPACYNNGTCKGIIGNFTCDCEPGFTGRRCGTDIDECESNPCLYNGTCNDEINMYTCDCIPGITGTNCQTDIDECLSSPCLYGQCIDKINRFECNCTDTGFKGVNCEIDIDECESNPCMHGATCEDKIKDYSCVCQPGYTGRNCETDIDECLSSPCQFNSSCHERSNEALYDIDYPGFENLTFTYAEAAGYLCECVLGSKGVNCEINIDDCMNDSCSYQGNCFDLLNDFRCECYPGYENDTCNVEIDECDRYQPCMHGSTCIDKIADYDCTCAEEYNGKIYAGKNCSFELTACRNNLCDQGDCEPYLINEAASLQGYQCLCSEGYTGRFCNISTTMSFTHGSFIQANVDTHTNTEMSLRFRTTLTDSVLLSWADSQSNNIFVSIELVNGGVCLFQGSYSTKRCIIKQFNNAAWQTVHVNITGTSAQVTVSSSLCQQSSDCVITTTLSSTSPSQSVSFGSLQGSSIISDGVHGSQYVGCMEDVTVKGSRLTLVEKDPQHSYTNLELGCLRTEQCFISTCHQKGSCIDLWNDFRCDCYRPYLGPTCNTEHTAATFAYNNSQSFATFTLPTALVTELKTSFDLSFFMRTRQSEGLMMFLGSNTAFITAGLELSHIVIRIKMCNLQRKVITENGTYSDGERHLLRIHRNSTNLEFSVGGVKQYETADIVSGCQFDASDLHLGGKTPFGNTRKKRGAVVTNNEANLGNFDSTENFKGTIQDIQLNDKSLEFYPLDDPSLNPLTSLNLATSTGLQESEVTDPMCEMTSPCENNSTCSDVFFNDFKCDCLLGYRGKKCSELDFCVTGECPTGTVCQSLLDGFECLSNATFNGRDSVAFYGHNLPASKQITEFSFKFRTLARNGKILHIGTNNRYYRAQLTGSYLIIGYKLDDMDEQLLTAMYGVSTALWYEVEVIEESSLVVLTLKDNDNVMLVNASSPKPINGDSLSSILRDSSTLVSVGINEPYDLRRPFYQGCFGEIRIGGILLPFYNDDEFVNNTSKERFLLQSGSGNFVHGCKAGAGCQYSQCKFGSQCVDDYYSYTCSCGEGYAGRWCQDRADYCLQGDECFHQGHCYSGVNSSLCQCTAGYTGDRCEVDVDECATSGGACQNGGTCQNTNGTSSCNCPTGTVGDYCEAYVNQTCDDNPCVQGTCTSINVTDSSNNLVESFNCTCNTGYHGYRCSMPIDNCAELPCKNGATCTSVSGSLDFSCTCPNGYTGATCETNEDDCPTNACENGGVCVDGLNTYTCNCTASLYYKGPRCTVDINECEEQQPCQNAGLCINVNGGEFNCDCRNTGYDGTFCETDIDECTVNNPCLNGANCTNTDGDYTCSCTDGYEGKNCGTPNCTGINCTIGTCQIDTLKQQWLCNCPEFYEGKYCRTKGLCAYRPCEESNTLQCQQNSTYSYDCICKSGWEGDNCTQDIDECDTVVCQNGATCENLPGLYQCICVDGYKGNLCETEINECDPQPCKNGGLCTDLIGGFECNCTDTGYSNETCEVDEDECLDFPCYNGGVCENTDGSYTCTCPEEFGGQNCEVKTSPVMDDDDNIIWYIVGPSVAVVLILIIIGVVCFISCVRKKRATRGAYSPSRQEVTGSRVELGNVMKKPPLERLI